MMPSLGSVVKADARRFLFEDLPGQAQLGQLADHRQHDVQARQCAARQDGAELLAQQLRALQAQTNPAHAQEGVGLGLHRHIGQRLVTANVQGTHHQVCLLYTSDAADE